MGEKWERVKMEAGWGVGVGVGLGEEIRLAHTFFRLLVYFGSSDLMMWHFALKWEETRMSAADQGKSRTAVKAL